ncbi:hypothetical protein Trydic_g10291 [Trypoxylus dichotomus]
MDRRIVRLSKEDPFQTSVQIQRQISAELETPTSVSTVQHRLRQANLYGRVARKKPLVNAKNREKRLKFAPWTQAVER